MARKEKRELSSKEVLAKIGLTNGMSDGLPNELSDLLNEDFDDLKGDLPGILRERYRALKLERHTLRAGMVVGWKAGLKNRRWPSYDRPCIVLEMLEQPVHDSDESGSTYFREPLDMIVGLTIEDGEHRGDFLTFHANSERYRPWPGE